MEIIRTVLIGYTEDMDRWVPDLCRALLFLLENTTQLVAETRQNPDRLMHHKTS